MKEDIQCRKRLFDAVEAYIRKHYVPENAPSSLERLGNLLWGGSSEMFGTRHARLGVPTGRALWGILDAVVSAVDTTFAEQLLRFMEKSRKKPSDIYTKAGITKQHFSKIKNNTDYKPTKETALAFAIVLHLSLDETKDLIGRAGFTLTHSNQRDLIVEFFIKEKIYDIDQINYCLNHFGFGTLTNRRNAP